jgi:hypothetical protein
MFPLEHKESVKCFISVRVFNHVDNRQDSLDGGSALRKSVSYTKDSKLKMNANFYALSGIRTQGRSVGLGKSTKSESHLWC